MRKTMWMAAASLPVILAAVWTAAVAGGGASGAWANEPAGMPKAQLKGLDAEHSALVLIEFQEEWLGDEGKLVRLFDRPDRGLEAAQAAKRALEEARSADMTVIHAPMVLSPGYPELGQARFGLRAAIPEAGTWVGEGANFAEGFQPVAGEPVVRGRVGASAFVGSDLAEILAEHRIDTLYLAGFATHVCVESTLRHAHDLGFNVVVLRDACAAFNDEQDAYFDEHVLHHFGHALSVDAFVKKVLH